MSGHRSTRSHHWLDLAPEARPPSAASESLNAMGDLETGAHRQAAQVSNQNSFILRQPIHILATSAFILISQALSRAKIRMFEESKRAVRGPTLSTPSSDRSICCMHGRVFPRTLCNQRLCQQQSHSGIPLPKQTQYTPGAYQHEEAFKRMAVRAGLWYAEKFSMWTRRICFQVYIHLFRGKSPVSACAELHFQVCGKTVCSARRR